MMGECGSLDVLWGIAHPTVQTSRPRQLKEARHVRACRMVEYPMRKTLRPCRSHPCTRLVPSSSPLLSPSRVAHILSCSHDTVRQPQRWPGYNQWLSHGRQGHEGDDIPVRIRIVQQTLDGS